MSTQDEKLTQEDAERFVDCNYLVEGKFDGKYKDFFFCRTEFRYRPFTQREKLDHFVEDITIYPKDLDFDLTDRRDYDPDEMELYFDFYDGIAIECDEDGSRVSFRPLIILYPTIEICCVTIYVGFELRKFVSIDIIYSLHNINLAIPSNIS